MECFLALLNTKSLNWLVSEQRCWARVMQLQSWGARAHQLSGALQLTSAIESEVVKLNGMAKETPQTNLP